MGGSCCALGSEESIRGYGRVVCTDSHGENRLSDARYVSTRHRRYKRRVPCRNCKLGSVCADGLTHPWLARPWRIRLQFRVQPLNHVIILFVHHSMFLRSCADFANSPSGAHMHVFALMSSITSSFRLPRRICLCAHAEVRCVFRGKWRDRIAKILQSAREQQGKDRQSLCSVPARLLMA